MGIDTSKLHTYFGVEKSEFDSRRIQGSITFKEHREVKHNNYNYMYFLIYLWYSSPVTDNALEMYVRSCVDSIDVSWFPSSVGDDDIKKEGNSQSNAKTTSESRARRVFSACFDNY